jgi:hypothetical protein
VATILAQELLVSEIATLARQLETEWPGDPFRCVELTNEIGLRAKELRAELLGFDPEPAAAAARQEGAS